MDSRGTLIDPRDPSNPAVVLATCFDVALGTNPSNNSVTCRPECNTTINSPNSSDWSRLRCESSECSLLGWQCTDGYHAHSYGCSECADSHYRSGRLCMECPGGEHEHRTVALFVILLFAALGYVASLAVDKKSDNPSAAVTLLIAHMQVLGVVSRMVRAQSFGLHLQQHPSP